jgi:predicted DNA-binding transcriptional regulator AlpA
MKNEKNATLRKTGFMRQAQLLTGILPFSAATHWGKVAAKTVPAPGKLSAELAVWKVEEVRE